LEKKLQCLFLRLKFTILYVHVNYRITVVNSLFDSVRKTIILSCNTCLSTCFTIELSERCCYKTIYLETFAIIMSPNKYVECSETSYRTFCNQHIPSYITFCEECCHLATSQIFARHVGLSSKVRIARRKLCPTCCTTCCTTNVV
jgi:hypothetical protein